MHLISPKFSNEASGWSDLSSGEARRHATAMEAWWRLAACGDGGECLVGEWWLFWWRCCCGERAGKRGGRRRTGRMAVMARQLAAAAGEADGGGGGEDERDESGRGGE
ncbi:hypothetical protein Droror1_Dr00015725 [Drosera rotundifolia]